MVALIKNVCSRENQRVPFTPHSVGSTLRNPITTAWQSAAVYRLVSASEVDSNYPTKNAARHFRQGHSRSRIPPCSLSFSLSIQDPIVERKIVLNNPFLLCPLSPHLFYYLSLKFEIGRVGMCLFFIKGRGHTEIIQSKESGGGMQLTIRRNLFSFRLALQLFLFFF